MHLVTSLHATTHKEIGPMAYTKEKIRDLVNGKVDDDTYQQMLSSPVDYG